MKQILSIMLVLCCLGSGALAAVCSERIDSDGDMCRECALGNFGADAMRAYTGADIALFASGDLGITLPAGTITPETIADSFPNDQKIVVCQMTADEIRAILEQSVSHITLDEKESIDIVTSAYDGFFCISGFAFSYDASAPVGQRVYNFPLVGTYTVAISEQYAAGTYTGSIREAVTAHCDSQDTVMPPTDSSRITVLGAWENRIVGDVIPPYFVLLLTVLVFAFSGARYRRRLNTER